MPVFELDDTLALPHPELAREDGLLAIGGDLEPRRLLLAYAHGIFPWYGEGEPILWHSPDPRCVLPVDRLHVPASLRKAMRRGSFEIRLDTAFEAVVEACAASRRPDQEGTWVTEAMKHAYAELFRLGFAHSAEAWRGGELAGGLYGVSLGAAFFGESMFFRRPDASKVAFVALVQQLRRWTFEFVDCQVYTAHMERFGASMWPRRRFLKALSAALDRPTRRGPWQLDPGPTTDRRSG